MKKPLFSVIVPTYNRAEKLLRGLTSLNEQTFCDFEVLVCDDGSTDHTRQIVDAFRPQVKFLDLRYFFEPNWGGPAHARNTGIRNSVADWICFLDSDDLWYPEKLATIMAYMHEFDFIYHAFDLVDDLGKSRSIGSRQLKYPVFNDLMLNGHNGCIINSGVCVRKEIISEAGGFSEDRLLIGVEDADLWLKISRQTERFKYIPQRVGKYFLGGENLTMYNQSMIDKLQRLFDLHAHYLPGERLVHLARKTNDYHLGRIRRIMGDRRQALKLFRSASGSPNPAIVLRSFYWILLLSPKSFFCILPLICIVHVSI